MNWIDIREKYPNRWVHLKILNKYKKNNVIFIDEVELISVIDNEKDAMNMLLKSKDDKVVYHTSKETIEIEIRKRLGFRIKHKHGGESCE